MQINFFMSKYLGKLLLEAQVVPDIDKVSVKYVAGRNAFCFNVDDSFKMYVGKDLCLNMFSVKGMLPFQYQFSVGYVVKEKKNVSELHLMRADEFNMLGGRRNLILNGLLDNDDDFDYLCVIQYLFKVSDTVLKKVMRLWKRRKWGKEENAWLKLEKRSLGCSGRKPGSKNSKSLDDEVVETLDDALFRIAHNKKSSVAKGILEWYIEACKEECKLKGLKFDKDKCISEWNKLRLELGVDM